MSIFRIYICIKGDRIITIRLKKRCFNGIYLVVCCIVMNRVLFQACGDYYMIMICARCWVQIGLWDHKAGGAAEQISLQFWSSARKRHGDATVLQCRTAPPLTLSYD